MANDKVLLKVECNTVGELLDSLSDIAKNPELWDVMDAGFKVEL